MPERLSQVGGGGGNVVQAMPLIPGQQGSTSEAESINTKDMGVLYIVGTCNIYVEGDASNYIPITDFAVFTVDQCKSVHVSAAIRYAWS